MCSRDAVPAPNGGARLNLLATARAVALSVLAGAGVVTATAQQTTPDAGGQARAPSSRRIAVDVVARDSHGVPVTGLGQNEFQVYEDKQPRALVDFRAVQTAVPPAAQSAADAVRVTLLLDAVNIGTTQVSYAQQQVESFLKGNGGELPQPTTLVVLTDTTTEVIPEATRDGRELADKLSKVVTGIRELRRSSGFYGAVDRFEISLAGLRRICAYEKTLPGRKVLVWISPGWPLLTGPGVQLTSKEQETLFRQIVEVSAEMRAARVTLYSVDPLGTADAGTLRLSYYEEFLKGQSSAKHVDIADLGLQVLAVQSGGRVLVGSNDTRAQVQRCYDDTKAFYELTFDAAPAEHADEYRKLEVRSTRPGVQMQTRTGYYVQP